MLSVNARVEEAWHQNARRAHHAEENIIIMPRHGRCYKEARRAITHQEA